MGEAKRKRLGDKSWLPYSRHQDVAHSTCERVLLLMRMTHDALVRDGVNEGAPVVQGAICAILQFMADDYDDAEIRQVIDRCVAELLPQLRAIIAHGEAAGSA